MEKIQDFMQECKENMDILMSTMTIKTQIVEVTNLNKYQITKFYSNSRF